MALRFLGGTNIKELRQTVEYCNKRKWVPIVDYAKEGSTSKADVISYMKTMQTLSGLSPVYALKLSSFTPFHPLQTMDYIINVLKDHGASKILLDAEVVEQEDLENNIYNTLITKHNKDSVFLYKTYQMYKKESTLYNDIETLPNLGVKLVRGAYYENDYKTGKLWDDIEQTHTNYNDALQYLSCRDVPVIVASHNMKSVMLGKDISSTFEFAQLLGMQDDMSDSLAKDRVVYKYVPYGSLTETLPYLIRRLYENKSIIRHFF